MSLHIVTGSDDNYVPGVLVLLASVNFHNPGARFTVLDLGISPENRARLDRLGERLGARVDRVEVPVDVFDHVPVRRAHLTRGTFLRLLIPELLPADDRVVYMDCDMVVLGDLSLLATVELGEQLVAAVRSPGNRDNKVNAGLLVMNLPRWRAEDMGRRCLARFVSDEKPVLNGDEATLNLMARGRIVFLPPGFNLFAFSGFYPTPAALPPDVRVVHYVVDRKPWRLRTEMDRLWWFHARRIADLLPPPRPLPLRARLSQLNRARRKAMGLWLGRRKYRARREVARAMEQGIVEPYLARWAAAATQGAPAISAR